MEKQTNEKRIERLNDLIRINNDRYEGYSHALHEIGDTELTTLFFDFAHKSRDYALVLAKYVNNVGGAAETGTTTSGKIYRVWMDIRAAFSSKDRKAILASCEFGEDAALKAYDDFEAETDLHLDNIMMDTIRVQKSEIKMAHDRIRSLRDAASKN